MLAWVVAVSLAIVAGLRMFYHDGNYPLTWLNAFTRYVYLPIYACLGWAIYFRRWRLAVLAALVAGCQLTWLAPEVLRDGRFDVPDSPAIASEDSTTIRILFANVKAHNQDPVAFVAEVSAIDADVVVFVEYYPPWNRLVGNLPVFKPYKYGTAAKQMAGGEFAVFSKLPIENAQRIVAGQRMSYSFDVRIDGTPLRIFGMHAPRPMELPRMEYENYWNEVTPLLLALPEPSVIVGDFNATPHSRVYQTLTADRLRSAHDDRGRGYATTWPNGTLPIPPIRIDQAFLTPGVECVSITEGRGLGSDHKPLILDVRIRDSAR